MRNDCLVEFMNTLLSREKKANLISVKHFLRFSIHSVWRFVILRFCCCYSLIFVGYFASSNPSLPESSCRHFPLACMAAISNLKMADLRIEDCYLMKIAIRIEDCYLLQIAMWIEDCFLLKTSNVNEDCYLLKIAMWIKDCFLLKTSNVNEDCYLLKIAMWIEDCYLYWR